MLKDAKLAKAIHALPHRIVMGMFSDLSGHEDVADAPAAKHLSCAHDLA